MADVTLIEAPQAVWQTFQSWKGVVSQGLGTFRFDQPSGGNLPYYGLQNIVMPTDGAIVCGLTSVRKAIVAPMFGQIAPAIAAFCNSQYPSSLAGSIVVPLWGSSQWQATIAGGKYTWAATNYYAPMPQEIELPPDYRFAVVLVNDVQNAVFNGPTGLASGNQWAGWITFIGN